MHVAYDGSEFHGWQVQPGLSTIQGVLEEILSGIEGEPVAVAGSGRTDAGVHALAQVAAFSMGNRIPVDNLRRAVNRLLPLDIRIFNVEEVDAEFHPRFDATAKTYEYRLFRGEIVPPFERRYVYHYPYPLRVEAMAEAAVVLEGLHDFTVFAAADPKNGPDKSKVRRIFSSRLALDGERLVYRVRGSGFLKHMVRNIVGVLLEVGKGNISVGDVEARLNPRSGIRPGPSVPGCGLTLIGVEYGGSRTIEANESHDQD